jgi:hypothetical protein
VDIIVNNKVELLCCKIVSFSAPRVRRKRTQAHTKSRFGAWSDNNPQQQPQTTIFLYIYLLMADIGVLSLQFFDSHSSVSPIPIESLIVDQESAKELQCGICLQLLNKPRQCKNGHLFCLNCISQCLEKSHECPSCRCSLKMEELARSLFVEKRILKLYTNIHIL